MGTAMSRSNESGMTPSRLVNPMVERMPTSAKCEAGPRIELPVSLPSPATPKLAATPDAVPPLEPSDAQRPVLLEVMPGAALRAFGLPFKGYKGGRNALELRRQILDGLPNCSPVPIVNLDEFREYCFANDDCLDAVVAAVAASLWATDTKMFRVPDEAAGDELNVALLEGWLYAPVFACS